MSKRRYLVRAIAHSPTSPPPCGPMRGGPTYTRVFVRPAEIAATI